MRIENTIISTPPNAARENNPELPPAGQGEREPITFYLVRHGETLWNEMKEIVNPFGETCIGPLIQGTSDIELTAKGEMQAQETAKKISDLKLTIDAIYTSPLKRASKTAQMIASQAGLVPIEEQDLTACYWGDCEGRSIEYRKEKYHFDYNNNYVPGWETIPTRDRWNLRIIEVAESRQSQIDRMRSAFIRIASLSKPGSSILAVTHNENLKSFTLHCHEDVIENARLNQDFSKIIKLEKLYVKKLENCCIHKFIYNFNTNQFTYCGEVN